MGVHSSLLVPCSLDARYIGYARVTSCVTRTSSDHLTVSAGVKSKDAPYIGKGNWVFPKDLLRNKDLNEKNWMTFSSVPKYR